MIVRLTPEAQADIREAQLWYAGQGVVGLDEDFGRALEQTFARLGANPRICRKLRGAVRRVFVNRFPFGVL